MNLPLVNKIVDAVLYEGYTLYPYRPSSKKNRQRFTFGRVYPHAYHLAQKGLEPFTMRTECLALSDNERSAIEIRVRFLQVVAREIFKLHEPLCELPAELDPALSQLVPELQVGTQRYISWQEAVEQEIILAASTLRQICISSRSQPVSFPAAKALEPIRDSLGSITGVIQRRRESLTGTIEIRAEQLDKNVIKVIATVTNETAVPQADLENQDAILMRTFASTHTVLSLENAEFVSLLDPPSELRAAIGSCKNQGTWPVLVGEEQTNDRSTVLSSPIILYDYPKIAAESPGDLFDSTEIDEILTLRILTMTEEEKEEMRRSDDRARQILERTESLPEDQLLKMHGAVRELRPLEGDFFSSNRRLEAVEVKGERLRLGDRVKIRPRSRADIMDIALAGKTATIEAIEEDAESRIHLALVLDDDPGRDLGLTRQPGHRFFYALDEVEPLRQPE